jgi:hypothetical protein
MADTTFVNGVTLSDAGWFNDANTITYKGLTTQVLVGGGAGSVGVWTTATGTGSPVRASGATLTTSTLNGWTLTAATITMTGTTGQTYTLPTTSATLARTDAANTFTGHQTIEGITSTGATGTGNIVFSASPTLTGTLAAAAGTFSSTLGVTGDVSINTNKFVITGTTGSVVSAGSFRTSGVNNAGIGIGSSFINGTMFSASGAHITSGLTSYATYNSTVVSPSDATTTYVDYFSQCSTANSAFTCTNLRSFHANPSKGAASVVTNVTGFYCANIAAQGSNQYAFYSDNGNGGGGGANTWAFYEAGATKSAFLGKVAVGTTTAPTATLDVTGNIAATTTVSSAGAHTANNATAIPAGGTAGAGYNFSSTSNFGIYFGSGAPSLSAAKGSLYLRSDGSGTNDRMYVNTNGSTTWTAVVTVA